MRKLDFCNQNFSSFKKALSTYRMVSRNNGFRTDKGVAYLLYGFPDEIKGDNYFSTDGSLISFKRLPIQEWYYKKGNKKFIFFGQKLWKEASDLLY